MIDIRRRIMKHEWRKKEKGLYLPKNRPEIIDVPSMQFITISGEGHPQSEEFQNCIEVLYAMSYAVKMNLKRESNVDGYMDYTVYPLEGVWDIRNEARATFNGVINKDDLVYKLMIRQPDFVTKEFFNKMVELTKKKKGYALLDQVTLEQITDGLCVQMLHLGSYDDEPESFRIMEEFTESSGYIRESKVHREIYLSDFRKVEVDKLKTVLRFKVLPQ